MNDKLRKLLQTLVPFIILGFIVATLIGIFIMFSYLLIWGLIIGGILWIANLIKNFLFPPKPETKPQGRIIEHDDHDIQNK